MTPDLLSPQSEKPSQSIRWPLTHAASWDDVAERLNKTALELCGIENFVDMVADETITTDCEELFNWLTEKNHPVLGLEPLM